MTDTLSIRPIKAGDKPAWTELWRQYLEFYDTVLPEDVYDATFARICDPDKKDQCGLIAVLDGKPVAIVHYLFHAHNWKIEQVCYLQDLYALPEARGLGVGRKLIESVYEVAEAEGRPSVYWLTQELNTTARQLYDRVGKLTGFVKYSRADLP